MAPNIRLAAMSLNWNHPSGADFEPWLQEVKAAGYDGISGFAHFSLEPYLERPGELKAMLDGSGLGLASVGVTLRTNPATGQPDPDYYVQVCEFMAAVGCPNLVYIDPKGGPKAYRELGQWLNRLGEISRPYGIRTLYHNHTRGIGESFRDLERVYAETDPGLVSMMLDLGHATKDFAELPAGGRAIAFLEKYWDKIKFMEFKDWNERTDLNTPLGEGYCRYDTVFRLIRERGYEGWILVEQNGNDGLSLGRSPLECAAISRAFVRRGLGV